MALVKDGGGAAAPLSISVVLPAYNEEPNVAQAIAQAVAAMQHIGADYEIIVVDDGSRDNTAVVVEGLVPSTPGLRLVRHPVNRGYGGALRSGFAAATKEWILLNASDNQFDMSEVTRFLPLMPGNDLVCGYRAQRQDPAIRRLNAFGWNLTVRLLFGYLTRDIDCGFKVFRRSVLERVTLTSSGAMVDTELLAGARARGYRVAEVPVSHFPRRQGHATGANLRVILRAFGDLFAFRRRLWDELRRG
jgi:glycosyltransferase involved in cell wall biosynthesis